ncbi:hypothetical protein NLX78_22935 [Paenibacillus sp. Lou8.1]|uniref:hypothetical protein n=1 Tax=Paenibacillus sp. Lou8.1 TaxID=2962041 RepID=UPI0020B67CA9|nr:hypothetical protein [Paenibacillus sp. Lou8.1]MCP3810080.1 hypothetical protein [Paenibacillus sp. Lou8.1]
MSVFVVSYDLNKAGKDYAGLYSAIKSCGPWMHKLDSTWLISTQKSAEEVYNILAPHIDSDDKVLVIKADKNWHAKLDTESYDWLRKHL